MDNLFLIGVVVVTIIAFAFLILFDRRSRMGIASTKRKEALHELDSLYSRVKDATLEPAMAVVKADTIFDQILKLKVPNGSTMGERLKLSKEKFRKDLYNHIWEAHKTRNQIVHDNISIDAKTAEKCLNTFIKAVQHI